jgi:hypothetical protein
MQDLYGIFAVSPILYLARSPASFMEIPERNRTGETQMNQTIHAHQIIHAFAHRADAKVSRAPSRCASRTAASGASRKHFIDVRGIVTTALMLLPLLATEFLLGDVASDGWFAGVIDQTSKLLALGSPF